MEILIGIPFGIVGALIFIAGYSDRIKNDPALVALLAWCVVFPLVWVSSIVLVHTHPALLALPVIVLTTLGIHHYRKIRAKQDEPMPLEYYTKLKRQDAAKAVADWDARAEELLIEAGVACICPTTPVVTHLTWEDRRITKTKRHPVIYCPVHAWRGLELAKSPKNLVG